MSSVAAPVPSTLAPSETNAFISDRPCHDDASARSNLLPTHLVYRPDVDGLRAVAVTLVVLFHAFPKQLSGGFVGVDIFFIISGFLISTIILSGFERQNFNFANFYGRRVKRIFPALLLTLAACVGFGWFVLLASEYKTLGKHIAGGAGFVANFILLSESGYFDADAIQKPLLHLWSLGIEEQFYIVWPLLLWSAYRLKINRLALIVAVALTSFAFNVFTITEDSAAAFYTACALLGIADGRGARLRDAVSCCE